MDRVRRYRCPTCTTEFEIKLEPGCDDLEYVKYHDLKFEDEQQCPCCGGYMDQSDVVT